MARSPEAFIFRGGIEDFLFIFLLVYKKNLAGLGSLHMESSF